MKDILLAIFFGAQIALVAPFSAPHAHTLARRRRPQLLRAQKQKGFGKKAKPAKKSKSDGKAAQETDIWVPPSVKPKVVSSDPDRLLWAALMGQTGAANVRAALAAGARVDAWDPDGWAPLHEACRWRSREGCLEACEALLDAGADPNARARNVGAVAPLHVAVSIGENENKPDEDAALAVDLLLGRGAEADLRDGSESGATPLHFAACSGAHECARRLLAAKASVHATCHDGRGALHFASFAPTPEARAAITKLLVGAGGHLASEAKPWALGRDPLELLGPADCRFALWGPASTRVASAGEADSRSGRAHGLSGLLESHTVLQYGDGGSKSEGCSQGYTVHRFTLADPARLNSALEAATNQLRDLEPSGVGVSNKGGYHSRIAQGPERLTSAPCWDEFRAALDEAVARADAEEIAVSRLSSTQVPLPEVCHTWVNVNGPGHYNELHDHSGSRAEPIKYSGVYYARVPGQSSGEHDKAPRESVESAHSESPPSEFPPSESPSGCIAMRTSGADPSQGRGMHRGLVHYSTTKPEPGMLLIFPANLLHAVLPFRASPGEMEDKRLSISFNVS